MIRNSIRSLFWIALTGVSGLFVSPSSAQESAGLARLNPEATGLLRLDGVEMSLLHFDSSWKRTWQKKLQVESGYPRSEGERAWETRGVLRIPDTDQRLSVFQRMELADDRKIGISYQVACSDEAGIPTKSLALELRLPASHAAGKNVFLDDVPVLLPQESKGMVVVPTGRAKKIRLPSSTGSIAIERDQPMTVRVEDMRAWKYPSFDYRVRIQFPVSGGSLKKSGLRFKISHQAGEGDVATGNPAAVVNRNENWAPYEHQLDIEPGSVFDFSFLRDAPAGKHGPLIATKQGRLEFAGQPGKSVRLWGVNLCFSANYLEPDEAEKLAARLAASGYNAVRFHHYDVALIKKGRRSDRHFDPGQLDKLDHLFAAMKRNGLYINIDLFTLRSRSFTAEEKADMGMSGKGDGIYEFKALVPISDAALENWKTFTRTLLAHVNPHTGLTWAEDPALVGICPVNEDVLQKDKIARVPSLQARYQEAFERWWDEPENRLKARDDRDAGYNRFLHESHINADRKMHAFIRSLGSKALLTGVNFHNMQSLAYVRDHYDVVDNHQYWAHPEYLPPNQEGQRLTGFSKGSATRERGEVPRGIMQSRLWGKPYTVTEFNFLSPNQYRAEGGVLMPAYASLQGWSALYNFEYAARRSYALEGGTARLFSLTADPIGLLADRVSALVFRRGDIEPAQKAIGFAIEESDAFRVTSGWNLAPEVFTGLGLVVRIGSGIRAPEEELLNHGLDAVVVAAKASAPAGRRIYQAAEGELIPQLLKDGVLPAGSVDASGNRFTSDTGQIELNARDGAMTVKTSRGELFVLPAHRTQTGERVSVKNGPAFATVSVVSVDGKPLAESSRILVLHLTDALPEGTRFAGEDRTLLESWGNGPHLVKAGDADVVLRMTPAQIEAHQVRGWAVSSTGKRLREIPLARTSEGLLLHAATVTPEGTQLAYEITMERLGGKK